VVFPEGATCERVNVEMLAKVFSGAPDDRLKGVADKIDLQIGVGKLDRPERLTHFFGQIAAEAGDEARLEENLHYTSEGLQNTFPYFFNRPDEADELGRTAEHPSNPQEIANRVYAGRNGNGDSASGDGWRFCGRGLIHLPGRGNYREIAKVYQTLWDDGVDFEEFPDLLLEPRYAVRSALCFWIKHELFAIADDGISNEITDRISRIINGGDNGKAARQENVTKFHTLAIFENVCKFSVSQPRFSEL